MSALCTCCFVTFQAMSSMEISQNVGTPPENLANDDDYLSGSEGTPAAEAPAPEPQPKPAAKPKPKPKPKGKAHINLANYPTSTNCIRVRWDHILIDRHRSEGHVRGLNPDRVQAPMTIYYGHHHLIVLMICWWCLACVSSAVSGFRLYSIFSPFDFTLYCLSPNVQLGFGMPSEVSTSTRLLCNIARKRKPKITPCLHGRESLKAWRLDETLLCPYKER